MNGRRTLLRKNDKRKRIRQTAQLEAAPFSRTESWHG